MAAAALKIIRKMSQTNNGSPAMAISDTIQRVFMVSPIHFRVEYSINPWMGGVVDNQLAIEQWNRLKEAIEKEGIQVLTLEQAENLPDMVFSCNSGLALPNSGKIYLSKFRHSERTGEQTHFAKWFMENNFDVLGTDYQKFFEGGGDAFFSDNKTLWAGYGPRSSKEVYDEIAKHGDFKIILCELILKDFYHLDTCLAPVGTTSALWFPSAFSNATQDEIRKRLPDAIEVDASEANAFVCNAITIRRTVISPIGMTQKTRDALAKIGYNVLEIPMSEFMKAGGACQCLVMKLF